MAVARLEGHRGAHDAGGRGPDGRPQPLVRRQRPTPRLAARLGIAGPIGRKARLLTAQDRCAAEGIERRQVGMRRHRIGLDDDVGVARRGPRQRIERQAVADRGVTGDG